MAEERSNDAEIPMDKMDKMSSIDRKNIEKSTVAQEISESILISDDGSDDYLF